MNILIGNLQPMIGHVSVAPYILEWISYYVVFLCIATESSKGRPLMLYVVRCYSGDGYFPIPGFKIILSPSTPALQFQSTKYIDIPSVQSLEFIYSRLQ